MAPPDGAGPLSLRVSFSLSLSWWCSPRPPNQRPHRRPAAAPPCRGAIYRSAVLTRPPALTARSQESHRCLGFGTGGFHRARASRAARCLGQGPNPPALALAFDAELAPDPRAVAASLLLGRLLRWRQQHDVAALLLGQHAIAGQFLEVLADHRARRTDQRGQILVRQAQGDHSP